MRKICNRGMNWFQIYNDSGDARMCCFIPGGKIGNLCETTAEEAYLSSSAQEIRRKLSDQDYSICDKDACPYLMMDELDSILIDYNEKQQYPEELWLGFENVCNYHCRCCSVHKNCTSDNMEDKESRYELIEKNLEKLLPKVKKISANGQGELFVSKHTLNLLANWMPESPKSQCKVVLETNGSLFDEEHWKKIENLGQYHLTVCITVMSFNEEVYQYLSGTKLPISNIENNLRFVKKLREKGIINYLTLATVVQEQNFREMPEFARRCIEEFGADYVRLRPYVFGGAEDSQVDAWFKAIRNPEHPLYDEYKRVMQHPIFQNPKVHDQSGGKDYYKSRPFPYKEELIKMNKKCESYKLNMERWYRYYGMYYQWLDVKQHGMNLAQYLKDKGYHSVVIYGMADPGHSFYHEIMDSELEIVCGVDKNPDIYSEITLIQKDQEIPEADVMVVCAIGYYDEIKSEMEKRITYPIISLEEIVYEMKSWI